MCKADTKKIRVDEVAILARVGSRTIFQWAESGKLHYEEGRANLRLLSLTFVSRSA